MTYTTPVILVTGASTGIGKAIAERFAAGGHVRMILLARRHAKLHVLAEQLAATVECHTLACDLNDHPAVVAALAALPESFRAIDVLVNNAGLALGMQPAQRATWQDWQTMIATNCSALAHLTHQLLPGMVARNHGHIVNIGSIAGHHAYPGGNVYGATKAFVAQFSQNLRADLLGTAVRVTHIEPGMVAGSEFSLVRFAGDQARADSVYTGTTPLQPADIAEAVHWAISAPAHVNICSIEMMPVCQAPAGLAVHRQTPP
jgi:3-hydroxy acid dehydrogenase/malonic semialdehyde reductase